jgi:hypothetical protein
MNKLIPNSDSLPLPADNVYEAFPPAKKKAAPVPPPDEEPIEDDEEDDEEFEDEDADVADEDDEDEEPVEDEEDEEEEEPEQSATVKVTVTAAPDRPAAPAKKAAPFPPAKKKPTRPARGFAEAAMDAVVESYIRPLREYTTKSGKHVEIHSEKWHRCVEHVKERGDVDNAYAVCTASLGAGKSLKKGHGGNA